MASPCGSARATQRGIQEYSMKYVLENVAIDGMCAPSIQGLASSLTMPCTMNGLRTTASIAITCECGFSVSLQDRQKTSLSVGILSIPRDNVKSLVWKQSR